MPDARSNFEYLKAIGYPVTFKLPHLGHPEVGKSIISKGAGAS